MKRKEKPGVKFIRGFHLEFSGAGQHGGSAKDKTRRERKKVRAKLRRNEEV